MLSRQSWFPQAEHLQLGQRKRVDHDCGSGRTLLLSRDEKGFHGYCFRCNDSGYVPPPAEALADRLARLARLREGDVVLASVRGTPSPAAYDVDSWPIGARLWLYAAGIGRAEIGTLGIYYHPPSDRVVVPVLEAGVPVFWQARAYQKGRQPKYLGPALKPAKLLARWGRAEIPTLTEDMLSSIKIGTVAEGWCVFGTKVSDHMIAMLLKRGGRVNVWLDPDSAGRKGAAKINKQLRAYGLDVRDILSERDPKLHTRDDIKRILNEDCSRDGEG